MTGIDTDKFAKPEKLNKEGLKAYQTIMKLFKETDKSRPGLEIDSGGCTTFYSPKQWAERGEMYGRNSALIVCHDGGDVANFFNYDYGDYQSIKKMDEALRKIGLYAECCTAWYTAIYKL